ncbi:MAG TPA: galactokinase, partial [Chitinophagaceae bacterium]|nr:galactokinase [Chitinophagaceae bacterium]
MKEKLQKEFQTRFRTQPKHIFFCPGRINLIGEHIDYNGGRVMPCAISLGTWLAVGKNNEDVFRFQALNFPESAEIPVQPSYEKNGNEWYYYPLGVINELSAKGNNFKGLDMLFAGDLPIGSGLSSSASIEVVTIFALDQIFELQIPSKEMAVLSKKVENEFIGVNSGIMDQFAVVMGRKDHALLLDCDTLEFEYLPLNLDQYILAIINTNKPRKLVESRYNERYGECRQALAALQQELNIRHLCEIAPDDYLAHRHLINDPIIEKRALHVVLENERVEKAVQALKA